MKIQSLFIVSLLSLFCTVAYAEQATGLCKDGTAYTGASKRGACRGHKGLQEWYGDKVAPAAATPAAAPMAAPPASAGGAVTGICKDGTPYTGSSKRGACRGHKGLKEWYADKQTAPVTAPTPTAAAPGASYSGTATGLCKDGTLYTGSSKRGACRGHKGLQEWYADKQSAPAAAPAAAPATAPVATPTTPSAAATGICKDGTEFTGASKRGACRGHKGLKEWFGDRAAPATAPVPGAAGPTAAPLPSPAAQPAPTTAPATAAAPVAGGAPGLVWVNTKSKIYHCQGSRFYGNTKEGEYMSEAQAQTQGYHANRKKTCGINQ